MAFIFADLIVLPIIAIYRKYYGWPFAIRITVLMFVTMAAAALLVDALFTALGLVPDTRPTRDDIFGSIQLDYKLVLNALGLVIFAALFGLTMRRGATDPVCGMKVDRAKALQARARRDDVLLLLRALHEPISGGARGGGVPVCAGEGVGAERLEHLGDPAPNPGVGDQPVGHPVAGDSDVRAGLRDDVGVDRAKDGLERLVRLGRPGRGGGRVHPRHRLAVHLRPAHRPVEQVLERAGAARRRTRACRRAPRRPRRSAGAGRRPRAAAARRRRRD